MLVAIVSVEVVGAGFVLNVPVAPEGRPLTLRVTGLVKPPDGVIVTLYVVEVPCCIVWLDGVALSAKFGGDTTPVPLNDTVCGLGGPLSVIVIAAERDPAAVGVNVTLIVQFA